MAKYHLLMVQNSNVKPNSSPNLSHKMSLVRVYWHRWNEETSISHTVLPQFLGENLIKCLVKSNKHWVYWWMATLTNTRSAHSSSEKASEREERKGLANDLRVKSSELCLMSHMCFKTLAHSHSHTHTEFLKNECHVCMAHNLEN